MVSLSGFGIFMVMTSENVWGVLLSLQSSGSLRRISINSLNVGQNSPLKPSDSGLLFVGSFKITVSISVHMICLSIFSISPWFGLGRLYTSKNLSISSRLPSFLA